MSDLSTRCCVLGIDSGGSKCDAVLARCDGVLLGVGRCEHTDPESGRSALGGSGRTKESVTTAARRAVGDNVCEEIHIGVGAHYLTDLVQVLNVGSLHPHGISERDAIFALNDEDAGVAVLSGTGAVVFAKTRDGRQVVLDGLGPVLGDHGSGYQIGLLALRAAAKSLWHPRHQTSLDKLIFDTGERAGLASKRRSDSPVHGFALSDMIVYTLGNRDRSEIASFAALVDAEANAGDPVAIAILQEAAADMADTLYDAVDTLGMSQDSYKMLAAGSVATRSRIYWQHMCKLAQEFAPNLEPVVPDMPPVVGATIATASRAPGIQMTVFRENLLRTVRERMEIGPWLS